MLGQKGERKVLETLGAATKIWSSEIPWRWHLSAETCRSWYLIWNCFFYIF